jgi:hypothetical protein
VNASFRIHTIRYKAFSIMPASTTIKQRYCEERWGLVKGSGAVKGAFGQLEKKSHLMEATDWSREISLS